MLLVVVYIVRRVQAEPEPKWYEPEEERKPVVVEPPRVLSVDSHVVFHPTTKKKVPTITTSTLSGVRGDDDGKLDDKLELTEI